MSSRNILGSVISFLDPFNRVKKHTTSQFFGFFPANALSLPLAVIGKASLRSCIDANIPRDSFLPLLAFTNFSSIIMIVSFQRFTFLCVLLYDPGCVFRQAHWAQANTCTQSARLKWGYSSVKVPGAESFLAQQNDSTITDYLSLCNYDWASCCRGDGLIRINCILAKSML